jgi:hypothetical protein
MFRAKSPKIRKDASELAGRQEPTREAILEMSVADPYTFALIER